MLRCNMCGREINQEFNEKREDCVRIVKDWGYFSSKDLQTHEIILCEECYDKLIKEFKIPAKITLRDEVL